MIFFPVLLDFFESSRLLRCIVGRRLESQKTVLMVGICEEKFKALSHVIQLVAQTFGVAAWSDPLICLVCFEDEAAVIIAAVTAFRSRCLSLLDLQYIAIVRTFFSFLWSVVLVFRVVPSL